MEQGFFDNLNGKQGALFGFTLAIAVTSLIGVLTLLSNSSSSSINAKPLAAAPVPSVAAAPAAPTAPTNIQITLSDDDYVRGNPNAKITLVEFSDLECPFCARFHPTAQQIVDTYPNDVKWIYKHFPLSSIHPKAQKFSEATECAGELGGNDAFWEYTDAIFGNQAVALAQLGEVAAQIGLNQTAFQACLDSGRYASKVQAQTSQAQAAGGTGTPYSVIIAGDQKIPVSGAQPFAQISAIIESLL